MPPRYQAPRGTQDILPKDQPYWAAIHDAIVEVTRLHGFQRIDTPVFESAALFEKGSGDTTDVVEKEMYTFLDRGGDSLALTPEGTPAIARAYLEHGMASWPQPVRLYTTKSMFRYDRPQKGRYRQHTQFDCEVLGSTDPLTDAELIGMLWELFGRLGISHVMVRLGSIDDPGPRRDYVEKLKDYFRPHLEKLSPDSQRRFDRNPLRLLDSKDERDLPFKDAAPKLIEMLSPEAQEHHDTVLGALKAASIPVEIDPLLVRGLDYYNRTVFEYVPVGDERAQSAMGGGGRYDGLIELIGGPPTPGMGFGSGIERIILEMERHGIAFEPTPSTQVFVAQLGTGASTAVFKLAADLRTAGIAAQVGEGGRSLKSQMRSANHSGARAVLILGEDEIAKGTAVVKPLDGGEQHEVSLSDVVSTVRNHLGGA